MPGHTNAALASYAELNCDGVAPPLYTGIEVGFSSLCIDKEITYQFVNDVLTELAALTPGEYLHIGGDEAHATTEPDYIKFFQRVLPMVEALGKKVTGWHELIKATPPASALPQYWGTEPTERPGVGRGRAGQQDPAVAGEQVVPGHEVRREHPARPVVGGLHRGRRTPTAGTRART